MVPALALASLSCRSPLTGVSEIGGASLSVAFRVPDIAPARTRGPGSRVLLPTTASLRFELYRNGELYESAVLEPGAGGLYSRRYEGLEPGAWRVVATASDAQGEYASCDQDITLRPGENALTAALFPTDPIVLAPGSNGPHAVPAGRSVIFSFTPPYAGSWVLSAPGAPGALAWNADGLPLAGYAQGATRVRYPSAAAGAPVYFSVYADGDAASVSPGVLLSPSGARLATFAGTGSASVLGPADEAYDEIILDIAELSDGSVIAVGEYYDKGDASERVMGFVIKYTESGAVDRSFGSYGWLSLDKYHATKPNAVTVQDLGGVERVIVSGITIDSVEGPYGYFAARVTADGRLDGTYGNTKPEKDGYYTHATKLSDVALSSTGKAAVDALGRLILPANINEVELRATVLCVRADGSDLDYDGFGGGMGYIQADIANIKADAVAIASNGNVFVASTRTSVNQVYISKLDASGNSIAIMNGQAVYGAYDSLMYPGAGTLTIGGLAIAGPSGDQVVYLAGNEGGAMLVTAIRAGDGSLYYGAGTNGIFIDGIYTSPEAGLRATGLIVEPDGNIVVTGYHETDRACIATRISHDGGVSQLDTAFDVQSGLYRQFSSGIPASGAEYAYAAILGRNGDLWFGGSMNQIGVSTQDPLAFRHPTYPDPVYGASRTPLRLAEAYFYDALTLDDGSIVAVGCRGDEGIIAKYTPAGQLDTAFGNAGFRTYSSGGIPAQFYAVALAPATGNIIAAGVGEGGGFAMSVDPASGAGSAQWGIGSELTNADVQIYYSIAIAQDGSTLLLGKTGDPQERIHRYTVNPTPAATLAVSGTIYAANYKAGSIAALPDGSFAACTMTDAGLARLVYIDSGMTMRGTCTLNSSLEPRHTRLAIGDDGYYVVGRTAAGGAYQPYAARFSIEENTPMLDWEWHGSTMASTQSDYPYGIAAHPDGRVYLTGSELVSMEPLSVRAYVIGLDAGTGQPDPAFGSGGRYTLAIQDGALAIPMAIAAAPNGDLAVGGLVGDGVGNELGMLTVVR